MTSKTRMEGILRGEDISPKTRMEDAVKSALDVAGVELPPVTVDDNGMLLGVSGGKWGKVAAPTELPAVSGDDNGKVLGVNSGAWAAVATQKVIRVPFTLTPTEGGMSAATEADFSEMVEELSNGAVLIADAVLTTGTVDTHIVAPISGNLDSEHTNDVLHVFAPSIIGNHLDEAYGYYMLLWTEEGGVVANSVVFQPAAG